MMSDTRDGTSMITWERGHKLIVMAEHYLLTGDAQVLPGIEAIKASQERPELIRVR